MESYILVIDDEKDIRDIFAVTLEANFSYQLLFAESSTEAITIIDEYGDKIKFIFCDFCMPEGNGDVVYQSLLKKNINIPFALVTAMQLENCKNLENFLSDDRPNYYLSRPFTIEEIVNVVNLALSKNSVFSSGLQPYAPDTNGALVRIQVDYLSQIPLEGKIYIRISNEKVVKISDHYDPEVIDKYMAKKLREFYVSKDAFNKALSNLIEKNLNIANENTTDCQLKLELQVDSIKKVENLVRELGITPETQKMVSKVVDQLLTEVEDDSKLKKIFDLFKGKEDYIQEHALLTTYTCTHVLKNEDWFDSKTIKKIATASIFQNIALTSVEMAKVYSEKELEGLDVSEAKKEKIGNHMADSARFVLELNENFSDDDILNMVLYHHYAVPPYALKYSKRLSSDRPLISCFNICSRFSHMVLISEDKNYIKIVQDMGPIYGTGVLKRTFSDFKQSFEWYEDFK